jgi:hypothetical protein
MKKRILMISPPGFSPVRAYRGEGAFLHLHRLDPEIEILFPRHDESWKDILGADIVYFFRSFEPKGQQVAQLALDMKKPIWFDLDDDVYHVRRSHPNYAGLSAPGLRNILDWFLRVATVVTVSTPALAESLKFKCHNGFTVIPNAIDDYTLKMLRPEPEPRGIVHWRGGSSHQEDLLLYADELKKIKDCIFFHGWDPWFLEMDPLQSLPYIPDYYRYMSALQEAHPTVVIVPLQDCPFNRAKSNIAALEAIWAGAIPVVPDWPEWDIPGAVKYYPGRLDMGGLARYVEKAMELPDKAAEEGRAWVLENRVLSVVNPLRAKIIQQLMEAP